MKSTVLMHPNRGFVLEVEVQNADDIDVQLGVELQMIHRGEHWGTFHYGRNELGFVRFGIDHFGNAPGHGGLWSSRPEVLFKETGIRVVDVIIRLSENLESLIGGHMLLQQARDLLLPGYEYVLDEEIGQYVVARK